MMILIGYMRNKQIAALIQEGLMQKVGETT